MSNLFVNKVRLYPNSKQAEALIKNLGCRRFVYNYFLELQNTQYEKFKANPKAKKRFTFVEMNYLLTDLKQELPWLQEANSQSLQQALQDLDTAFKNFFAGRAKYPRLKKRYVHESFKAHQRCAHSEDFKHLKILKHGWIKCRGLRHDNIENFESLQSITVTLEHGNFYASVLYRVPEVVKEHQHNDLAVGIDVGVAKPYTLAFSNGDIRIFGVEASKHLAKKEARRKKYQRALSRKKKGSQNQKKAKLKVSKAFDKERCFWRDRQHKTTNFLATHCDTVVVEKLDIRNMTRSAAGTLEAPGKNVSAKSGLNRELLRLAHGEFVRQLEYKTRREGGTLVKVNPRFTSQCCSRCGTVDKLSRKNQATFICTSCGHSENADINAARNILRLGLAA